MKTASSLRNVTSLLRCSANHELEQAFKEMLLHSADYSGALGQVASTFHSISEPNRQNHD
jgi:hypothetical protein